MSKISENLPKMSRILKIFNSAQVKILENLPKFPKSSKIPQMFPKNPKPSQNPPKSFNILQNSSRIFQILPKTAGQPASGRALALPGTAGGINFYYFLFLFLFLSFYFPQLRPAPPASAESPLLSNFNYFHNCSS